MKLSIFVRSSINSDGFDVAISDGDNTIGKSYNYGYSCAYDKRFANDGKPYVTDLLQGIIDKYHVTEFYVQAGENKFAGKDVTLRTVEKFKNDYCTELQMYDANLDTASKTEFEPREAWITSSRESRWHLTSEMISHVEDGGSLYMIDQNIMLGQNGMVLISTTPDGQDPESIAKFVPNEYVKVEVKLKEGSASILDNKMKQYVENGGKLYANIPDGIIKDERITISDSYRSDLSGVHRQYVKVSDLEYVTLKSDSMEDDFSKSVASISENDAAMEQ